MITQEDESRYVRNLLITAGAVVVSVTLVFLSIIIFSEHNSRSKVKKPEIQEVEYAAKTRQEQGHSFSQH